VVPGTFIVVETSLKARSSHGKADPIMDAEFKLMFDDMSCRALRRSFMDLGDGRNRPSDTPLE
jgi:hypothetical protein